MSDRPMTDHPEPSLSPTLERLFGATCDADSFFPDSVVRCGLPAVAQVCIEQRERWVCREHLIGLLPELTRLRSSLLAIQQERDELQASLDRLHGAKFSDRIYAALRTRAEAAEEALAAIQQEQALLRRVIELCPNCTDVLTKRREIETAADPAPGVLAHPQEPTP